MDKLILGLVYLALFFGNLTQMVLSFFQVTPYPWWQGIILFFLVNIIGHFAGKAIDKALRRAAA